MAASILPSASAAAEVAIVVRPDVPVDNLSFADLRKVLLGDRQFWTSGLRVTLVIRSPGSHEREVVLKTIYQMSEAQFRQYWIAKVFRAEVPGGPRIVEVRAILKRELGTLSPRCHLPRADGAFYFLLRVLADIDPMRLTEQLIRDHGVALIPGTAFGLHQGCHLRIAYAALPKESAAEGIGRLVRGLQKIVPS